MLITKDGNVGSNINLWYIVMLSKYKSVLNKAISMNKLDLDDQCHAHMEPYMTICCSEVDCYMECTELQYLHIYPC